MNNVQVLVAEGWRDYELIDSGEEKKLERWGQYVTVRPDPRAIWKKTLPSQEWEKADAVFAQKNGVNDWIFKTQLPSPWEVSYDQLFFRLKPTEFRHVGIFPEQAANWVWINKTIESRMMNKGQGAGIKILNLFAYTGGVSMCAALAGAQVTHVDSSRPAMMWASENAQLSKVPKDRIRWIQDDALKFVNREIRRGVKYDGIIMDPPRFGRGTKGEIWKLLENLPELVTASKQVLSSSPLLMLINAYTADVSSLALRYLLEGTVKNLGGETESGELGLRESASGKILPAGIYARWRGK